MPARLSDPMIGCPGNADLAPGLSRLFTELTGLHVDVLSGPAVGLEWDLRRLIAGCQAHARRWRFAAESARCGACALTHLRRALASRRLGHRFCGACGMTVCLLPVIVDRWPILVLALRANPRRTRGRPHDSIGRPLPGTEFARGVRLLRVLARDTELRLEVGSRAAEVARLRQAVSSHECEEAKLRRSLAHAIPSIRLSPANCAGGTRARQLVRLLLERIQREFAQPLVLTRLAEELGMNVSYLSTIFSREVGVPFKSYLTALRLQHAEALLGDPRRRVAEVANAVGYASADRFRAAFRASAGLSPARWRQALRVGGEA